MHENVSDALLGGCVCVCIHVVFLIGLDGPSIYLQQNNIVLLHTLFALEFSRVLDLDSQVRILQGKFKMIEGI